MSAHGIHDRLEVASAFEGQFLAVVTPTSMLSARNEPSFGQADQPHFAINYDGAGEEEEQR